MFYDILTFIENYIIFSLLFLGTRWRTRYENENGSIYFDLPEPGEDRLPTTSAKILGSTKSEEFVIAPTNIVSFVSRELSATTEEVAAAGDKKKKKSDKKIENVTLSGLQGVHNLENAVMMMVAMGYREEDCLRVLRKKF